MNHTDPAFWCAPDQLPAACTVGIGRPWSIRRPWGFGGYCRDGWGGSAVWVGGSPHRRADAVPVTIGLHKRDAGIELPLGCTQEETRQAGRFHNQTPRTKGALLQR